MTSYWHLDAGIPHPAAEDNKDKDKNKQMTFDNGSTNPNSIMLLVRRFLNDATSVGAGPCPARAMHGIAPTPDYLRNDLLVSRIIHTLSVWQSVPFQRIALASCLILMLAAADTPNGRALAAKRRGHQRSVRTGGGVYLTTPEPQNPLEHNNRAVELGKRGLWSAAIKEHEIALEGDPANPTFRMNLSGAYLRYGDQLAGQRKFYDAIHQFRMALYVDPNNNPADQNLDRCLKATGKNPDDARVRMGMADDADVSGNYAIAIVEYRKCCRMVDSGPMHYRLGRVLLKQGAHVDDKLVEGFKELTIAVRKDWKIEEKNDLADCHRQLGDILKEFALKARDSGAVDRGMRRLLNAGIAYRRAATINPSADAVRGLVEVAREAVAIAPNSFDNHLTLAGAYQLAGDFDRAKREYENCYKLKPGHPSLAQARKSFHLAVVKSPLASPVMLAGTLQKIEDNLRQNPDDPELLYLYGRGKEQQGDREKAARAYQAAATINPLINPDLQQGLRRLGMAPPETPGQAPTQEPQKGTQLATSAASANNNANRAPNAVHPVAAVATAGTLTNALAAKAVTGLSPSTNTQVAAQNAPNVATAISNSSANPLTLTAATPVTQVNGSPAASGILSPPQGQTPGQSSALATSEPKSLTKSKDNQAIASIQAKLTTGDIDGAQKELLALVDKEQTDGEAWKLLGQTHEKKGNLDEAQVCYRQSNDLKEPGADALLRQVSVLRIEPLIKEAEKQEKEGNIVGAKSSLSEAVNIAPNLSLPHQRLSDILRKLGDTKEADREARRASELNKQ